MFPWITDYPGSAGSSGHLHPTLALAHTKPHGLTWLAACTTGLCRPCREDCGVVNMCKHEGHLFP